ncbi:MAG: ribosomal-protein-alanine N-acetyltransferase [Anaerolineae bacterium]|nr:MAG: ribosomal-protein-alanine N-acetyltransferase [Anaerolineae bacterium]
MRIEDLGIVHEIDGLSFSLPWPANAFRYELMENKNSRLWVAELAGQDGVGMVVGVIVVWLVVDEAHIATLAVHPDYRRRGIATQLLQTALQACARLGMRSATLEVRAGNLAAQTLYRRFGFEVVGRRRAYYQDNHEDALIMTLSPLPCA